MPQPLTDAHIRKVAELCQLAIDDSEVADYRTKLSAVIGYVERLSELDLRGTEPLAHIGDAFNQLRDDAPGPVLPNESLMRMAPDPMPPFIRVPKVIDGGSGS